MKKAITCVCLALAIIILVIASAIMVRYFFASDTQGLTQVGPKIDVLVIASPGQTEQELYRQVEEGNAEVLLLIENKNGEKQAYTFNTLESLMRLEKNNLGFLDSNDIDFKNLNVARYDALKRAFYFMTIKAAPITIIEPNRNYLIGEILSDPQNHQIPAGIVNFSDGSKKELRMVKMQASQIDEAKLLPAPVGEQE